MILFAVSGILTAEINVYGDTVKKETPAAKEQYSVSDFRRITSMASKILAKNHYSRPRIDAEFSGKIFEIFFDRLDPMHMFFTQKDVEKFAVYRNKLAQSLIYGEYEFAFQVYDIYRHRYAQYRKFTEKMLAEKIDFTQNETISTELDKCPRPADEQAMFDLWRRQIKNELLSFRLNSRIEKETSAAKSAHRNKKTPEGRILQRQRDIGNGIEKCEKIDILGILLDSMARAYGAHSDYQAPKLSQDFEIQMSLSLSGIGATLTSEDGYIKIVELVPGGPAAQSGKLKINDRIVSVTQENGDTVDLIDMPVNQAVQHIRGKKGTKLVLDVLSGNSQATFKVELVRDKINLTAGAAKGEVRMVNGIKVGILTLPSFYMDFDAVMRNDPNARKASSDVQKILEDFNRQSVQSIVIDLRGNGGGSLPDAIVLSGLFLSGQPVVQVHSPDSGVVIERDPTPWALYSGPLVVLTSKLSASAAEIFTGALADANRAVIVGDSRTFGKGTVLRVESLDRYSSWFSKTMASGSLTFEIAMFFRPGGSSVQQMGITPDITLPSLTEEMEVGEIFLDNHLPWNSMPAADSESWDGELKQKIAALKKLSDDRIAQSKDYQAFIKQIKLYRTIRERKELSLNEQQRYAEYIQEKNITEEAEKLFTGENGDHAGARDFVLEEAANIAADLSKMQ